MLFLLLALCCLIILGASTFGVLAPVSLPTAERTAKINTPCIPSMSEKQYAAMPASGQASSQVGFFFENGADNPIILPNNTADRFFAIPVTNELKIWLNLYYKKAKCSLISLMYVGIPSLFLLFFFVVKKVQRGFFICKA